MRRISLLWHGAESACAAVLLGLVLCVTAWGDDTLVSVYVNGKQQNFQPAARVRDGVAYAPLRASAEAVGAEVRWMERTNLAVVCRGQQCVPIKKNQGIVVDGRLLIPLRLMAEALACDVRWNAATRSVHIATTGSSSSRSRQ